MSYNFGSVTKSKTMKKILVPTDFSVEASYALEAANEIAKQYNFAQITLLHVIEVPSSANFNTMGEYLPKGANDLYFVRLMEKVKENLNNIISDEKNKGLCIVPKVKIGHTYKTIAEGIAAEGVDLIIMGSKGTSGMDELFIGSNAEKVVRFAKCPVITVKNKPKNFKIRDIVFASDFNEDVDSIQKLKELQEMFFAKLHLLYVNTPSDFETSLAVRSRMEEFISKYKLDNYTINIYDANSEEEGITEFSKNVQADIVSLATHNRQGFLRFLMGSIAEDLVNHSKSVLFTFPIKEKA